MNQLMGWEPFHVAAPDGMGGAAFYQLQHRGPDIPAPDGWNPSNLDFFGAQDSQPIEGTAHRGWLDRGKALEALAYYRQASADGVYDELGIVGGFNRPRRFVFRLLRVRLAWAVEPVREN